MHLLCIDGSPKDNGKTILIAKRILSKINLSTDLTTEFINLRDLDIKQCKGCFSCNLRGIETCPLKDDIYNVFDKMKSADGLILSAPTYTENVPAVTKLFFDRLNYIYHRPEFFGKPAIVVSTVAFYGIKGALKQLGSISDWGYNVVDKVGIVTAQFGMKYKQHIEDKIDKRINKAAKVFEKTLKSKPKLRFNFINYVIFQAIKASCSATRFYTTADFNYYKDREYYIDIKIPFFAKIFGKMIGLLIPYLLKRKFETLEK